MPDKFTLLLLDILFFFPVLSVLLFRKGDIIKKYKSLILSAAFLGLLAFSIGETLATMYWKAWWYDFSKTLDIRIGDSVIEIFFWSILVPIVVGIVTVSCAEREEENKPVFTSFFKP